MFACLRGQDRRQQARCWKSKASSLRIRVDGDLPQRQNSIMKKLLLLLLVTFSLSLLVPDVEAGPYSPVPAKSAIHKKKHRKHRHKRHRKHHRKLACAPAIIASQPV